MSKKKEALIWWKSLTEEEKESIIKDWKEYDGNIKWSTRMIQSSHMAIELIYNWYMN
jgi:hypothetical protein